MAVRYLSQRLVGTHPEMIWNHLMSGRAVVPFPQTGPYVETTENAKVSQSAQSKPGDLELL